MCGKNKEMREILCWSASPNQSIFVLHLPYIVMSTITDIKSLLKQYAPVLKSKYPIDSIAVFGSYARGEQKVHSDIDLLVEFNGPVGWRFVDLAEELEQLLQNRVDLICRKGLQENFWNNIKDELVYVQ
jgi:predicted nucleotidyltransferase